MNTHLVMCPGCSGSVIINLNSFPISQSNSQKLHIKCPLCCGGFYVGYVVESYEKTVEREPQDTGATHNTPAATAATPPPPSAAVLAPSGGGSGGLPTNPNAANDQRSNSMKPNNSANRAAGNNRDNQMNPNNPAYRSSPGHHTCDVNILKNPA